MMSFEALESKPEIKKPGSIWFLTHGDIEGETLYCFGLIDIPITYHDEWEEMTNNLLKCKDKKVKVTLQFKNDKPTGKAIIDAESLGEAYADSRYNKAKITIFKVSQGKPDLNLSAITGTK